MAEDRVKFWMVWAPAGRAPTYKHHSKESAVLEAQRLAKLNPNSDFYVLKAVGGAVAESPAVKPIQMVAQREPLDKDIPF